MYQTWDLRIYKRFYDFKYKTLILDFRYIIWMYLDFGYMILNI